MEALNDEVESLEAILMEDVLITRNSNTNVPELIETTVFPIAGDESSAQQFVCVTLQVLPPPGYPEVRPEFKLLRPRGLDDACISTIMEACNAKLEDSLGFPVVFDLIDVVREHLTVSNLPSGQCVVCLYGFTDGDEFTRTECYHYLHSYCLARHLNASRRNYHEEFDKLPAWQQKTAAAFQACCPVCREPINDDSNSLKCAMPPAELQNAPEFELTKELRELQQRMSKLFMQQKERGAIIDVEAESGTVISIETEEEMRRRLQRKKESSSSTTTTTSSSTAITDNFNENNDFDEENKSGSLLGGFSEKQEGAASTNFSITVPPKTMHGSGRSIDPTNNNYHPHHHYNRRHHRGGRRHHHRDRERDYERYERNHQQTNGTGETGGSSPPSSTQTAQNHNNHHHNNHHNHNQGKQTKSHASNSAHTR